ncbi:MAG: hypothetical protein HYZ50_12370 [Deltaproteobacteria bacterium]|nr:hypothetical protein [Deltaproteobacteria bacterium]
MAMSQLGIPATLQDALMARLDRLGIAKEIFQIGAAIGREFSYELLAAVAIKGCGAEVWTSLHPAGGSQVPWPPRGVTANLRLVHRRVRHQGFARGEDAVDGVVG